MIDVPIANATLNFGQVGRVFDIPIPSNASCSCPATILHVVVFQRPISVSTYAVVPNRFVLPEKTWRYKIITYYSSIPGRQTPNTDPLIFTSLVDGEPVKNAVGILYLDFIDQDYLLAHTFEHVSRLSNKQATKFPNGKHVYTLYVTEEFLNSEASIEFFIPNWDKNGKTKQVSNWINTALKEYVEKKEKKSTEVVPCILKETEETINPGTILNSSIEAAMESFLGAAKNIFFFLQESLNSTITTKGKKVLDVQNAISTLESYEQGYLNELQQAFYKLPLNFRDKDSVRKAFITAKINLAELRKGLERILYRATR